MVATDRALVVCESGTLSRVDAVFALLDPLRSLWRETVKGPRWSERGGQVLKEQLGFWILAFRTRWRHCLVLSWEVPRDDASFWQTEPATEGVQAVGDHRVGLEGNQTRGRNG